jgi:hypothetical protein
MRRSLRKGMTSVYFQHTNTGHSIGAKLCESEVANGTAILSFTMRPVDSNQKYDEKYLHEDKLLYVSISDKTIIDGYVNHIKKSATKTNTYKLEILSQGKKLTYETTPESTVIGNLETLKLSIING